MISRGSTSRTYRNTNLLYFLEYLIETEQINDVENNFFASILLWIYAKWYATWFWIFQAAGLAGNKIENQLRFCDKECKQNCQKLESMHKNKPDCVRQGKTISLQLSWWGLWDGC